MPRHPAGRPPGRPADPTIRDRIVAASWDLFLAGGVEHVTVEAIARAARVSKVTVYKHFSDKDQIFDAGVRAQQEQLNADRETPAQSGAPVPVSTQLIHFGVATMTYVSSQGPVDFYAILSGELRRRPDLARLFYDAGPGQTRRELAQILRQAGDRGEIAVDDPGDAADELFGMWQGFSNFQLALSIDVDDLRADIDRRVRRSVKNFLTAHAYREEPGTRQPAGRTRL